MTTLHTTPLTGTLGAVISDVDLRLDLTDDTIAAIRRALLQYRVLFFRDQLLQPSEQVAFARRFGKLSPAHPIIPGVDGYPEVLPVDSSRTSVLARKRDQAAGENKWHTDVTFVETPPHASLLNAHVIPPRGGDTQWADLVDAYETLSLPLRQLVDTLEAVHDAARAFGYVAAEASGNAGRARLERLKPVRHPVVRVHPESGERALFVNPAFTSHIVGLAPKEGATILRFLYDHIAQPERIVRWRWRVGDLAFWDNRATAHYAVLDYGDERRRLHRVALVGERPYGPAAGAEAPRWTEA